MSTEQATRQSTRVLVPLDHDDTVDDHHFDTLGVLVRIVKAGAVGNSLRVEENEIGGVTRDDCAAVAQSQCRSGASCHLVNSLRETEKIEISGIMPQDTRKRSIESGMRLALTRYPVRRDARTIGADHDERIR